MALKQADRVRETSTTTGTGAMALAGAPSGYRTFSSVLSNGDTCTYAIALDADWEVGVGTYNSTGNTLTRTTVTASSNAGAAVNWGAGSKSVFISPLASVPAFSEVLRVPAGSVSSAAVQGNDDPNTGITFPAEDTIAIVEGGVEALRINSSAEVIVGNGDAVASPASRTLRGTDGSGTNIAGGNLTIQAGRGTGTGAGGYIRLMTSPAGTSGTTLQTATERVRIDNAGNVCFGGTPAASDRIAVKGSLSGGTNAYAFLNNVEVQSAVTSDAYGFNSNCTSAAASFTISRMIHFGATQIALGSSSIVTSQMGFFVGGLLTAATNNYGFYSNIASGTNRWNFYAAGTAANFFAGNVGVGAASAGARLHVYGTGQAPANFFMDNSYFVGFAGNQNSSQIGFTLQGKDSGGSLLPSGYVTINTGAANPEMAFYAPGSSNGVIRFGQNNGTGGFVEHLRFDAGGRAQFTANLVMPYQGAPTEKSSSATLTAAELVTGMLVWSTNAGTITLPTGTNIEGALSWASNNVCLDWFVINTSSNALSINGATGITIIGLNNVSANSSAQYRFRRTAANTFTVYKVG